MTVSSTVRLVCYILTSNFGPQYAVVACGTVGAYAVFTTQVTKFRTALRKDMNQMENNASSKAVDSLLNYEIIKYAGSEEREVQQYLTHLNGYEAAQLKVATSLAGLNFGQNLIFSSALTAMREFAPCFSACLQIAAVQQRPLFLCLSCRSHCKVNAFDLQL